MISAVSPIGSSDTSSVAYAAWASVGKRAQAGAVPALISNSVAAASGSEKGSAASDSRTDATTGGSKKAASGEGETSKEKAGELTQAQQDEVTQLKQRDKEVRTHEQAHQSAGAGLTGAASYTYTSGPDGKQYATGGEVSIDASPVRNDPSATIQKMVRVIAAALAPADPSSQDRAVASQASSTMSTASMEVVQQRQAEAGGQKGSAVDMMA